MRTAKNEWLKQQCEELEQLQRIHDDFNLHRKIKGRQEYIERVHSLI